MKGIREDSVGAWLAEHLDGSQPPFAFELIVGGHSNLTYAVTDRAGTRSVLRRPPLGAVLATAHDMAREHRIISAVGKTDVPVPRALALCDDESVNDAPFYVMNFVDGSVLAAREQSADLLPDERGREQLSRSVMEALAALHRAEPDDIGLGDLGRREGYLARQLKRWQTQWEKSKTRELPAMEETHELLLAAMPEQKYTGIVHGDYRLGNMLSRADGSVAAVLDWELCTLGDTLADLGYLLNSWGESTDPPSMDPASEATALPGFPSRDEIVRRYAELTGREVAHIDFYRSFQYWRLAAIVEGVMARYLKGVMGTGADTDMFRARIDGLAESGLKLIREM